MTKEKDGDLQEEVKEQEVDRDPDEMDLEIKVEGESTEGSNSGEEAPADLESKFEETLSELESARSEVEEQRQKADRYLERLMRLQAEFENYRKRTQREREDFVKQASEGIVKQLIDVSENLERALTAARTEDDVEDREPLVQGIEMTLQQLNEVLEREGLSRIDSVGKPFDPDYHEAVGTVESDDGEENLVVREIGRGYILNSKVIKPAKVQVSSGKRKKQEVSSDE
jgi:molecular chaperone GrpE